MQAAPLNNVFNSVSVQKPDSSRFDLSYEVKTSLKMGELVPINVQEMLPGDKYSISSEAMFRLVPMLAPVMQRTDITIHHFFVPNRLLWPNWEKYITGGSYDNTNTPPVMPHLNCPTTPVTVAASDLFNYMGLPITTISEGNLNVLPIYAYHRIWYDWYRDENLQSANNDFAMLPDGALSSAWLTELEQMRRRAWGHDYFTSSLPFAQKGTPVDIPIDITGKVEVYTDPLAGNQLLYTTGSAGPDRPLYRRDADGGWIDDINSDIRLNPNGTMYADFDNNPDYGPVTIAGTINDLRTAMALQKWLELNARAGSRYIEHILAHFGVRTSDYRLQRAEYLGGSKTTMAISEVLQTSETGSTPQGNMAGHGMSLTDGGSTFYKCEEHGHIISILSVIPATAYCQGIPKLFRKTTDRFQFAFPQLAKLGETPVLNEELYYVDGAANDETFGYLPIFSEYRFNSSRVSGQMATTLSFWHQARLFSGSSSIPLNASFIQCFPDKRIFAVTDPTQDEVYAHIYHRISCLRKLPYYGSPGGV